MSKTIRSRSACKQGKSKHVKDYHQNLQELGITMMVNELTALSLGLRLSALESLLNSIKI